MWELIGQVGAAIVLMICAILVLADMYENKMTTVGKSAYAFTIFWCVILALFAILSILT